MLDSFLIPGVILSFSPMVRRRKSLPHGLLHPVDPVMARSPLFSDGQSAPQVAVLRKESFVVAALEFVTSATKRARQV